MLRCPSCGLRLKDLAPTCPLHGALAVEPAAARDEALAAAANAGVSFSANGPAASQEVPPRIPGFELRRLLGRGGFGVVYEGTRAVDGLTVAVKVSLPEQASAARLLAHEGELLTTIGPPYVPRVLAQGDANGQRYLVIEFIDAPTLADRLVEAAGPMPLSRFLSYVAAILEAVHVVHERGFVHADLKPENVFVDDNARVRLIDFGSARGGHSDPAFERTEELAIGTAEYMSPEQCEARPDLDVRADIYSLGVLFYEMLSGVPPFWGNATEVREAHCSHRPPRFPPELGVPAEIEEVIQRCLTKDRERRFENVKALRSALTSAFAAMPSDRDMTKTAPPTNLRTPPTTTTTTTSSREQRSVGLLFFESSVGLGPVRQALAARGAQLAQARGSQYVAVFGHDVGDNPARAALLAAQSLVEKKVCTRVLVDVATVSVQRRPNGEQRFFSSLFSKKEQFPLAADPEGILLRQSAVDALANLPVQPAGSREGIYCPNFSQTREATVMIEVGDTTLVGRSELMGTLTESARQAGEGSKPTLLSVVGEPGYGKSLLAARLAQELGDAHSDATVLAVTGVDSAGSAAYPILRDLLRAVLRLPYEPPQDSGEAILSERLGPSTAELWAVGALILGWVSPDHPALRMLAAAPGALRSAAARVGGEAMRRAALTNPVFVVIDDAHWLEQAALDAIEYAAMKDARAAFWACAVARPTFRSARPNWGQRAAHTESFDLGALDGQSSIELIRRLLLPVQHVPQPVLQRLAERTQGVPRLIVELITGLKRAGLVRKAERGSAYYLATSELDELPDLPVVQWAASREVEALPAQLAGHARLAAVLGDRFTSGEIEGVLGKLEKEGAFQETVLDASVGVRRLVDRGILVRHGERIGFRHALLQDTIYRLLPEALRERIHRAAFEMFQEMTDLPDEQRLPRLALHAAKSGLREEAASIYLTLATRAEQLHAYMDAELMYTRALENLDAGALGTLTATQGRGLMRYRAGNCEAAMKDLVNAFEVADRENMTERKRELLLDQSTVLDWLGDFAQSADLAQKAEALGGTNSELTSARVKMALGRALIRSGEKEAGIQKSIEAGLAAERLGDEGYETSVVALLVASADLATLGRLEEAEDLLARLVQRAESHRDFVHLCAALNNRGFVWFARGDGDNAIKDLSRVLEIVREMGLATVEPHALGNLGEAYFNIGQFAEADALAREAAVGCKRQFGEVNWQTSHAELLLARIAMQRDDLETVRKLVGQIEDRLARSRSAGEKEAELIPGDVMLFEMLHLALENAGDEAWEALGERCRAASLFQELPEVLEAWGRVARRQGRLDRARTALNEALESARVGLAIVTGRVKRELEAVGPS